MKVLIILDHAHVNGGQAKVALDSALGLAARGHRMTVFAGVAPVDPRLEAGGVRVVCLDQSDITGAGSKVAFLKQVIWNKEAASQLRQVLQGEDAPDLIHLHGWAKVLSPSVAAIVARSGKPIVYTFHDYYLFCPNGGFYDYHSHQLCHRTPLSPSCLGTNCDHYTYAHKLMRTVRTAGLTYLARLAPKVDAFITISDVQEGIVRKNLPAQANIKRLSNPIDVSDPGPKAQGFEANGAVLYAGRISPEKGLDTLLEASRSASIRLRVVGDGPESALKQAAYPQMDFVGWKERDDVLAEMRQARVLVFPSVLFEGQPLTVFEALAMGTPVIVSDVCAGREAVEDGVTGLWFKAGNANSLKAALERVKDDALVRVMSQTAHARYWKAPLTLDRHIDGLEDIYTQVLSTSRKAA
jgi:glycosyltransferase involved in cell wall biosynthesis